MYIRLLMVFIFAAGMATGWLSHTWLTPESLTIPTGVSGNPPNVVQRREQTFENSSQTSFTLPGNTSDADADPADLPATNAMGERQLNRATTRIPSISDFFEQLLNQRRYNDAIALLQEQSRQNEPTALALKNKLTTHLDLLQKSQRNTDFNDLIDAYLSIYYDDIDVLLQLADFHQTNGHYLDVVDVYLLAKTYAYSATDLSKVNKRFNNFVDVLDTSYTQQKNWRALIDIYAYIDTSGMMSSTHQYRQALAHLQSGDEVFAVELLSQLLTDSLVGQSAASTLNSLTDGTTTQAPLALSDRNTAGSIALQKLGNQYLVNLSNPQKQRVTLLIDTGASMTAMSRSAFNILNASGRAIEQEQRDFQTASGVTSGSVFSVPEIHLGPYILKNTQIAVIDFASEREIDGLLGMNVLGQFRFQIDQDNSQLLLSEK